MTKSQWPPAELVESNVDQEYLAFICPVCRPLLAFTSGHFPSGSVSISHSHPCVVLHGCLHGPIDLVTPEFRKTLAAGEFFLLPPDQRHHWESQSGVAAATVGLLVDAERPGTWPTDFGVLECCRELGRLVDQPRFFNIAVDRELRDPFWQVADILTEEKPHSRLVINSSLWRLLSLVSMRLTTPTPNATSTETARRIRRILLGHVYASPTLTQIAKESGLSVTRAKQVFSATYGCGIKEYLAQLKHFQAQRMLGDPELSIQEISHRLGFSSPAYFSRLFRADWRVATTVPTTSQIGLI